MYSFNESFERGLQGEHLLDQYFSRFYDIKPSTRDEQRKGIDRFFTARAGLSGVIPGIVQSLPVEYKYDETAARTGNVFVEDVSVDVDSKSGWVITSQSILIVYCIPGLHRIYISPTWVLRNRAYPRWKKAYPGRWIPNKGYRTHGILVPCQEYAKYTVAAIQL